VVVANDAGEVSTSLVCVVKYTYDERIEDGLYCAAALDHLRRLVEDPAAAGIELPANDPADPPVDLPAEPTQPRSRTRAIPRQKQAEEVA
jgi:hypothetical protein